MEKLENATNKLIGYILREGYRGHDPYDALTSPLFRLPLFKSSKLIRFGTQQVLKRFPLDLRKLLFVPKGYNPVTLGLCIQGYAYLMEAYPENKEKYEEQILFLIEELEKLSSEGYSGICWGYDFDWEARYAKIQAYQPTVVATGIITNALYECWQITGIQKCADLVISASHFVINDLNRTYADNTFCYSYSPVDKQTILNASMKGVRLLAQTYKITGDPSLLQHALPAVEFVVDRQHDDGAFYYSNVGKWVDNYHTGYVLDCLDTFIKCFAQHQFDLNLSRGFEFYKTNLISQEGMPKFYSNNAFPADCTAASQSILSLVRFGDKNKAIKVIDWMIDNMQHPAGYFFFRKFKTYTIKSSFMRWSNAWMFAAMALLLKEIKGTGKPTNRMHLESGLTNSIQ
jgi:hypothetical protein